MSLFSLDDVNSLQPSMGEVALKNYEISHLAWGHL